MVEGELAFGRIRRGAAPMHMRKATGLLAW
jgi:hypothetical protein